jgi:hypothetical protein
MRKTVRELGIALWTLALLGCVTIGGKNILVDFRSGEGIQKGDRVYLSGILVGTVSGQPQLHNNRARVPVTLYRDHKDAVPEGTVFLLRDDPVQAGRSRLDAYTAAAGSRPAAEHGVFSGARNRAEMILLLGEEGAARAWEKVNQ